MARQKLPDLIITELTILGMKDFGLVEELKLDPRTKDIPVVVVSAKDITQERSNGFIEVVYEKSSWAPRKSVDEIVKVIYEKGIE